MPGTAIRTSIRACNKGPLSEPRKLLLGRETGLLRLAARVQTRLRFNIGGTLDKLAVSGGALLLLTLVSGCSGAGASANSAIPSATATASPTPTVTKTVTVKATPTPSTIATTGSYAADLASLGVVPDSVPSYADWMQEQICDSTGSSLGVSVRSIGGNESGGGTDVVRLSVAYFCPEKSQEVESYLDYFNE